MELRSHPLMRYRDISNWPPIWVWIGGEKAIARGEVGLLKNVKFGNGHLNRFFIFMEHDGGAYVGCVLFDNYAFCRQIYSLLQGHRGRSIYFIGSLDVSHTL